MKLLLSLTLFVALVASSHAACSASAYDAEFSVFQDKLGPTFISSVKMKDMFLLGSHDAGTYGKAKHRKGVTSDWAVTQTANLEEQMCRGVRVFDVRFVKKGAGHGNWRIFHGSYLFEEMTSFARHVHLYCNNPNHRHETIILRIKVEDGGDTSKPAVLTNRMNFIKAFATQIDDECIVKRSIANAAQNSFGHYTIADIKKKLDVAANKANVFLMPYGGHFEGLTSDVEYARRVWPYGVNMVGKSSESLSVKEVCKGQRVKYDIWHADKKNKVFGWWMTMTGKVGYLHVYLNTKQKLFRTGGRYHDWMRDFVHSTIKHKPDGLKGVVVWTDFSGNRGVMPDLEAVMKGVNINIAKSHAAPHISLVDGIREGQGKPLVYSFLEESESVRRTRHKTLQQMMSSSSLSRSLSRSLSLSRSRSLSLSRSLSTTDGKLVICADKTDEEEKEGPNCIQDRIIPVDLFDDCDEGKNILEIIKDEKSGHCAVCGDEGKVVFLAQCADNSEHKEAWKTVKEKLKCCDFTSLSLTPAAKAQREELEKEMKALGSGSDNVDEKKGEKK